MSSSRAIRPLRQALCNSYSPRRRPSRAPSVDTPTVGAGSHAYAAAMQSLVTPFGAFCSNHLARLARVPVWLDQE